MKDNKQMPQIIILGVLVALCLGFIVFRLMGTKTQAAAPPPATPAASPAAGPSTVPVKMMDKKAVPNLPKGSLVAERTGVAVSVSVSKRDPFAPAFVPVVGRDEPVRIAMAPTRPLPPFNPPMPMDFGSGVRFGEVIPVKSADVFPEFRLTGIISGSTNIAIIRAGESERHIVREGQYINGRYRVVAINQTSVIIACGNDRKELRLGGKTNAS